MPLLEGRLGYFWACEDAPLVFDEERARPGFVQQQDRGIHLKLLVDGVRDAMAREFAPTSPPRGFVGICEGTGAVIVDIVGSGGGSLNLMGQRASTEGFAAQTLIATEEALEVRDLLLEEGTIRLVGTKLFDWAHHDAYESTVRTDPTTGLVQSATLELLPTTSEIARVPGLGDVIVKADWSLNTRTKTVVYVDLALEFTVQVRKPVEGRDLMRRLGALQLLVSAVFDGFVVADGGWARLPGLEGKGALWNSVLMRDPSGTPIRPYEGDALPFVDLPTLGGAHALSRWLRLSDQHPRAMAPIVNRWRRGPGSPDLRLVECAVAIEYWVACHRRRTKWAKESKHWPLMAAKQAAQEFDDFVGDRTVWADRLWKAYGTLKHDPNADLDMGELHVLAESAYVLLLGLVLDRVAGSKQPSRAMAKHHRFHRLGEAIREELGT